MDTSDVLIKFPEKIDNRYILNIVSVQVRYLNFYLWPLDLFGRGSDGSKVLVDNVSMLCNCGDVHSY